MVLEGRTCTEILLGYYIWGELTSYTAHDFYKWVCVRLCVCGSGCLLTLLSSLAYTLCDECNGTRPGQETDFSWNK